MVCLFSIYIKPILPKAVPSHCFDVIEVACDHRLSGIIDQTNRCVNLAAETKSQFIVANYVMRSCRIITFYSFLKGTPLWRSIDKRELRWTLSRVFYMCPI